MKLGVIADIHGNELALAAVMADLSRNTVDAIIQLGDAFNGPGNPTGVAELLSSREIIHIAGNGERMILATDGDSSRSAQFARSQLSVKQLEWIRSWPSRYRTDQFVACHGSPRSDTEYLLEEVEAGTTTLRPLSKIQESLGQAVASLILCGHSHIPRLVRVSSEILVLNPGSVGLPAYSDEQPIPHRMEVGSPCARYAIAELLNSGWRICHVTVPYNYEQAAWIAEKQGFADWVHALKTGYVL
jgi:putative phosphoesterase